MIRLPRFVLVLGGLLSIPSLMVPPATAQSPTPSLAYLDGLPPLLDRDLFFGDPEIAGAQLSPDGQYVSFIKPYEGVMNIWVKAADEPFEAARPVTADTERPVTSYFWSRDGRYVLYVQDKGGDENYHVYAVDPQAEPGDTGVPPARDLTDLDETRAAIYAVPKPTPNVIVVGLNDRDARYHDVYRLDLTTGERTLVYENTDGFTGFTFDLGGDLRLASKVLSDGSTQILRRDGDAFEEVYTCSVLETCYPVRYHKDEQRVYFVTNKGDRDRTALVLFDPATQEETFIEDDPEGEVDFGSALFSSRTDELVATMYVGDRLRIYPKDEQVSRDLETLREALPEGEIRLGSSTEDETKHLVRLTRDVDPGSTYLYDRTTGDVELLYRSRPELPTEHLAPMQPIRYTARDGLEIPAYLTLPKGVEPEKLALVVLPHGGPWARDTWGYDAYAQFFANRGYAVLQPNFRSSTGYGKAFLNAGNAQWGEAMQDDLTDGVNHLAEQGLIDPEKVAIFGGSYGGYATLAGLAFTPDVYAAGISFVGPSNLLTLLESIPPYWVGAREVFKTRMGDLDDPEDVERLKRQSPYFAADRIRAPLLVIQGANDPRVKQAESDMIVVAARENGVPVEYLVAEDEGHGFQGEQNRLASTVAMERFFGEHLGGRVQADVPEAIEQKLKALTVDVSTVELPETAEAIEAPERSPFDGTELRPMTLTYRVGIAMGEQEAVMTNTRTIAEAESAEGEPAWRIVDRLSGMMAAEDDNLVRRDDLTPLARQATMGPASIALAYGDARITGEATMGQTVQVDVPMPNPIVGDGGTLYAAVGTLPLAVGYTTTYSAYDTQSMAIYPHALTVTGEKTIRVPAGTYTTYVVETARADGSAKQEMYVDVDTGVVVKLISRLPNGALSTSELTEMAL